jgi:hypothetical protein
VVDYRVWTISRWLWARHWYQLCHLAKVLGGCGEEELIAGAAWFSQAKSVELENAFEMGKQHLDFLAQPSRYAAFPRLCECR